MFESLIKWENGSDLPRGKSGVDHTIRRETGTPRVGEKNCFRATLRSPALIKHIRIASNPQNYSKHKPKIYWIGQIFYIRRLLWKRLHKRKMDRIWRLNLFIMFNISKVQYDSVKPFINFCTILITLGKYNFLFRYL